MTNRTAIYARTSPDCPLSADGQVERLTTIAGERGWTVARVFTDGQATVKKDRRPGEKALVDAIRSGVINRVAIWSIDRIGRSLIELTTFLEVCRTAGVAVYLDQQNIDSVETNGLALSDMASMLALHLRQTRRDRILRGQAAVRGIVRFGRPPLAKTRVLKAKQELAAGKGVRQVARLAGISAASVSRLKTAMTTVAATA